MRDSTIVDPYLIIPFIHNHSGCKFHTNAFLLSFVYLNLKLIRIVVEKNSTDKSTFNMFRYFYDCYFLAKLEIHFFGVAPVREARFSLHRLNTFREYRGRRRPEIRLVESRDGKRAGCERRRTCEADEARALFRMNFYEISRHKTRGSPIGTYVRTLHPGGRLLLPLLSINRLGTGWNEEATLEIKID